MIWKIAKKEFLLNLMTFKFAVGTVLCVVLIAVFMPVLVNDYRQRLKTYNDNVARNEAELRKVRVYKNITPTVHRPPTVLSVFSEGLEKRIGKSAPIVFESVPEISSSTEDVNPYLSIFPTFDISLILRIVFSVLALLVAYDVISGERERGTLKLMLSGTAARYQVLLGKLLAGLMALVVPITIAFIFGLIILLSFPMVELTSSDWIRIGFMFFVSLLFISTIYNLGLLFSCLARRPSISLVLGLFVWIVFVVVIPNGSIYLATQIRPLEPEEKLESQLGLVAEKHEQEMDQVKKQLPRGGAENDADGAFGRRLVLACTKDCMEFWKKRYALGDPIKIRYANKAWEVKHAYLSNLFNQKYFANKLSRVSPIFLYENVMSILAGTDLATSQYFMERLRTHRNEVIEYIRSNTNNCSTSNYFTRCNPDEWEEEVKEARQIFEAARDDQAKGMNIYRKYVQSKIAEIPSLNLQDLPRFICKPDLIKSLQRALPDMILLGFANVLFFVLSFVAFMKYDIR